MDALYISFSEAVLLALRWSAQSPSGAELQGLLSAGLSRRITVGALYSTLDRLETKKLVARGFSRVDRTGKSAARFSITKLGKAELERVEDVRLRLKSLAENK